MRIARFEIVPTLTPRAALRAARARDRGLGSGGLPCRRSGCSRQMALAACATWPSSRCVAAALCAAPRARRPSAACPRARPAGTPIVLALTATHPTSAALGSLSAHLSSIGLLSPGLARAAARRALRLQRRRRLHGRAHARAARGSCRCSPIRSTSPASCSPTARCGAGWPCASASRCARSARAASCSTGATCRRRRASSTRSSCTSCACELGRARADRRHGAAGAHAKRAQRTGAYDLRALARPARLLVLAWNEHGPRSEPGPVASLAFWKQTLRTVLRAAPRSRVLMGVPTWGWQWSGLRAPAPSRRRRPSSSRRPRRRRCMRPYGARVGRPTPGSSPTAPCSSSC